MADVTSVLFCGMGCGKVEAEHFNDCEGRTLYGREWKCKCGKTIETIGGRDVDCDCGACYNGFGQRLRSDWRGNPSNYDDEIGDLEGYEMQHAND
ncbi:hypothetical protein HWB90_gp044 [Mycobacterium phage Fowlmouth]|uniref:Uncharacterized protein n=1 Tax=Mycobacterium phage Fowlmouth TaxID=2419978 RepID=A0A3G2KG77_9CAUD|nr:hypothetical protein HWB90_gp044 [Mycobacterium phage Fowlmouth]AYN57994.1 hypothetical protein SEA_FOWLMOUTH_44 [Mycobacterium phage Fowlmouth]